MFKFTEKGIKALAKKGNRKAVAINEMLGFAVRNGVVEYKFDINNNIVDIVINSNRYVSCSKCGGTGYITKFQQYNNGVCYECNGSGQHEIEPVKSVSLNSWAKNYIE